MILAILILLTGSAPYVTPMSLAEMVEQSDHVVVATVQSVRDDEEWVMTAIASVSEVWKGPDLQKISYRASGTWMCDITTAEVGETVLLFLHRLEDDRELHVVHAGRGRMPISQVDGDDVCTIWTSDVPLPENIETIPGPDPEYTFIRRADLAAMKAFTLQAALVEPGLLGEGNDESEDKREVESEGEGERESMGNDRRGNAGRVEDVSSEDVGGEVVSDEDGSGEDEGIEDGESEEEARGVEGESSSALLGAASAFIVAAIAFLIIRRSRRPLPEGQ